jgi:hypothetical protein
MSQSEQNSSIEVQTQLALLLTRFDQFEKEIGRRLDNNGRRLDDNGRRLEQLEQENRHVRENQRRFETRLSAIDIERRALRSKKTTEQAKLRNSLALVLNNLVRFLWN